MPIWTGAGADNNWSTTGNWDTGVIPTNLTDAIFDGVTGANPNKNCTVNTQARPCANFNTTGYTGTITFDFDVQVNGNVTLGAGMLFGGTAFLNLRFASAGLTRNVNCPSALTIPRLSYNGGNSGTITFTNNTTITNLTCTDGASVGYTFSSAVTLTIDNGTFNSNSIVNGGARAIFSNTILSFSGTCTLTGNVSTGIILGGGTIQTASGANLTIARSWTIVSGPATTINFSQGTVTFGAATTFTAGQNLTLNFPPSVGAFNNYTASSPLTLQSNVQANGTFLTPGFSAVNYIINGVGFKFIVLGNFDGGVNNGLTGTATLSFEGNINASWLNSINFSISNLTIDKGTGTLTIVPATATISSANYTVTSGTIVHTGTLTLSGNQTITHQVTTNYNILTIPNFSHTKTINGLPLTSNQINVNSNFGITFAGSVGFNTNTFTNNAFFPTLTFATGSTYTVNNALILIGTNATPLTLASNVASSSAFFNLQPGARQHVAFATARDINSTGGQTIWDWLGTTATLTRTQNWNPFVISGALVSFTGGVGFSN